MSFLGESLNFLIYITYLTLFVGFNYFLLFYIFKIAKDKRNRTIKLFLASLLISIFASASFLILGLLPEDIKDSVVSALIVCGVPVLTAFLIVRFTLNVKLLTSLILGALYFIIYTLSVYPLFLTIGCMDSPDPNCGRPIQIIALVFFLILYLASFILFYLREKKFK